MNYNAEMTYRLVEVNNYYVKVIKSRSFAPFVLEQRSAVNDYTVTFCLSDSPMHGYSWWKFELYYIPHLSEELGLAVHGESNPIHEDKFILSGGQIA